MNKINTERISLYEKEKNLLSIATVVVVIILSALVWWLTPKYFLEDVKSDDIASIEVFNGSDGNQFIISEPDDISFIIDNIKTVSLKKDRISMGMGTTYNLSFLNTDGKEIDKFIIMTSSTIRKGIIFYECDGELKQVEEYLIDLEKAQFPDTPWNKG